MCDNYLQKQILEKEFNEYVNSERVICLLRSNLLKVYLSEEKYINVEKKLNLILNKLSNDILSVKYNLDHEFEYGRYIPEQCLSLSQLKRSIRHFLCYDYYFDFDIKNCAPNILLYYCKKNNIQAILLENYCKNRDYYLKKVMDFYNVDKKIGKDLFLISLFGGSYKSWIESNQLKNIELKEIADYFKELKNICKIIIEKNQIFFQDIELKNRKKNKSNTHGSFLSYFIYTIERQILNEMVSDFIINKENPEIILCNDGFMVPKKFINNENEFVSILNKKINEIMKYPFEIISKPLDEGIEYYPLLKNIKREVDDAYAGEFFVKLLGDKIQCDEDNKIYIFNEKTGIWDSSEKCFRSTLKQFSNELNFYDPILKKKLNYAGNEKNVNAMKKWIECNFIKCNFFKIHNDSSLGKLLFEDGIYDFKTNTFKNEFDPNIVFFKRIERPFPKERNEELIKKINYVLFESAFEEIQEENNEDKENEKKINSAGDFLKKSLCIALTGDYFRKKFYFGLGDSNSGKGVLVCAMKHAFEQYIQEFDANNFLYQPHNNSDEAKKLAWLQELNGVRITFSNELRMEKNGMDGNLVKAVSSGGDTLKIRSNYENQKDYVNKSTFFLLANDCTTITPCDSGIKERVRFIRYNLKFSLNPTKNNERKADPQIKQKFSTDEYKNALTHLFIDTYQQMNFEEKKIGGYIQEPICVIQETKTWVPDLDEDFLEKLNEEYEITNNPNDYIESSELCHYIINICKMKLSTTKIGLILKKLINLENNSGIIKNKKVRLGIKRRTN